MSDAVSYQMAFQLRLVGFPQRMQVGDFGYHPSGNNLVVCTKASKSKEQAQPPILRAPTLAQMIFAIHERYPDLKYRYGNKTADDTPFVEVYGEEILTTTFHGSSDQDALAQLYCFLVGPRTTVAYAARS